jgi:hypothetical protein
MNNLSTSSGNDEPNIEKDIKSINLLPIWIGDRDNPILLFNNKGEIYLRGKLIAQDKGLWEYLTTGRYENI